MSIERSSRSTNRSRRGEVLDPPNVIKYKRECLTLRKAMYEWEQIAVRVGITVEEAQQYTASALKDLHRSEASHAEMERQLMVEQLNDMIRAVRPRAIQMKGDGPMLDAIDKMIKLMDRKAKLLGLDQLPTQDIMVKLQEIASDGGYDLIEIEDIARDVLSKHRFKMPPRLFSPDATDSPSESTPDPAFHPDLHPEPEDAPI